MTIKKQHIITAALAIFGCYASYTAYTNHQQLNVYQYNNQVLQQDIEKAQQQIQQFENTYSDMYFELNSLTVAQFEAKVEAGEQVYAYIGRPDCSDCTVADPILKDLIEQHHLANEIYYVNVAQLYKDKQKWLNFKNKYQIMGTPVLVMFQNRQLINKVDKEQLNHFTKEDIVSWLQQNQLIKEN